MYISTLTPSNLKEKNKTKQNRKQRANPGVRTTVRLPPGVKGTQSRVSSSAPQGRAGAPDRRAPTSCPLLPLDQGGWSLVPRALEKNRLGEELPTHRPTKDRAWDPARGPGPSPAQVTMKPGQWWPGSFLSGSTCGRWLRATTHSPPVSPSKEDGKPVSDGRLRR